MRSVWVVVGFTFGAFFLLDAAVDLRYLKPVHLNEIIKTSPRCPFMQVNSHGLSVHTASSFSLTYLKAKIATIFDLKQFFRFWTDQMYFLHFFDEIILAKKFLVTLLFSIFCIGGIERFILKKTLFLEDQKASFDSEEFFLEITVTNRLKFPVLSLPFAISFVQNKFLILLFCFPHFHIPLINKKYSDFGEYVRDNLTLRAHSTDLTIFGSWMCLLCVVHSTAYPLMLQTIKVGSQFSGSLRSKLAKSSVALSSFIAVFCLLTFSSVTLGSAILSFALLHPLYSTLIVFESYQAWALCLFAVFQISIKHSRSKCQEANQEGEKRADHGAIYTRMLMRFRFFSLVSLLAASIISHVLSGIIGLVFNRKLFSLEFFIKGSQMFLSCLGGKNLDRLL